MFLHELRGLLRLAGPLIISQLGQVGMNTADTIMVGPLGATALAAVGIGSAIHSFGVIVCVGILLGMTPLVSQAFGAGDRAQCRRVLVQGVWLALLLSVPLGVLNWTGGDAARLLGQDVGVTTLTGAYLRALVWGIVPYLLFMAVRDYLEGMGDVRAPMIITFLGLGLNIVANRVFIYGIEGWVPAMGVVGTGWATTTVRWAMLLGILFYVLRRTDLHPLRGVSARVEPALLRTIARIGSPIGAHFGLEVGLFAFAAVMIGWIGPVELAAHQITINIAATTFMVALGVSMAGSIRVGQRIGEHRPRAMRRAALATYLLAAGFMSLCALVFIAAPSALIRLYTPDAAIITLGSKLLLVAAAFQVFDGAQVAGGSVLRGAAETRSPMVIAGIGYWLVGFPLGYVLGFPLGLGPVGVWIGLSAGLAVAAVLLAARVRSMLWRGPFSRLRVGGM